MYGSSNINELRRMLMAGEISEDDLRQMPIHGNIGGPPQENVLAQMLEAAPMSEPQMPQPRYDIAPMQQNSMRFESGPDAGRVVDMNFAPQQAQQPQERLGARAEVPGKGMGRYSADGSKVVGQGWIHDLFPKRTEAAEKAAAEKAQAEAELQAKRATTLKSMFDMQPKPQLVDGPNGPQWVTPPSRGGAPQPVFNGGETAEPNQAWLEKKYGKPGEDQAWNPDGTPRTIPGSKLDEKSQALERQMLDGMDVIDQMIGKRDGKGNLVGDSKPHKGFEDLVGAPAWGGLPTAVGLPPMWGTDAAGFQALYDQITGKAFLQAFESIKGGGHITEIEGTKATQAITRMKLAQSEPEFIKAATEFRDNLRVGMEKAKQRQAGTRKGSLGPVTPEEARAELQRRGKL